MAEKKVSKKDIEAFDALVADIGANVSKIQMAVLHGVYRDGKNRVRVARELGFTDDRFRLEEFGAMKSLVEAMAPGCLDGYIALAVTEEREAEEPDPEAA